MDTQHLQSVVWIGSTFTFRALRRKWVTEREGLGEIEGTGPDPPLPDISFSDYHLSTIINQIQPDFPIPVLLQCHIVWQNTVESIKNYWQHVTLLPHIFQSSVWESLRMCLNRWDVYNASKHMWVCWGIVGVLWGNAIGLRMVYVFGTPAHNHNSSFLLARPLLCRWRWYRAQRAMWSTAMLWATQKRMKRETSSKPKAYYLLR